MGAEEEDLGDEGQKADLRSEWLKQKVLSTLKVKPEKWDELDEEGLFPIKDFLDSSAECLFITLGERDKVCTSLKAPTQARKKSCFFMKASNPNPIFIIVAALGYRTRCPHPPSLFPCTPRGSPQT